jgi:histidinol dehydrogenase
MLAYGVEADGAEPGCEPVDLITGPGNIWVAAAKRLVKGTVGIDAEAGPTEVLILADATADPNLVAADLISQAEHDPLAAAVLVTDSAELAERVRAAVAQALTTVKHLDRIGPALAGEQSGIVLVDDLAAAVDVANAYGAEHLEIQTADPAAVAEGIRHAGAIFLGDHSPVSLGDYCAGSNHVLPTGGTARHSSGLSVFAFLRSVQVIDFDAAALARLAPTVLELSRAEDLPAHGQAVAARSASGADRLPAGGGPGH